eukprot:Pgem_evm2s2813
MKNINQSQVSLSLLNLILGIFGTFLLIAAVSSDWWIFTRNYSHLKFTSANNLTVVHFGLWKFCVDLDTQNQYNSGCHSISSTCQTDIGLGTFTVLGLREFGHCDGFNVTRAFVVISIIFVGFAVICNLYSWLVNHVKIGVVSMVLYLVAGWFTLDYCE